MKQVPFNEESKVFKNQLIRSSTSSAVNYRSAYRAKSTKDMINKLKIVEEELDESLFWLELIHNRFPDIETKKESIENNVLLSIIVKSIKTLKSKLPVNLKS
ncbi:four helix bundle protein [Portibacter marinus]|uniref:four helix bundle protein n=1 Tax=Portibacter marinus TaxID=2898660 RepID=UPI001F438334